MAYDADFAHRIRELLAGENGLTEVPMFGGLAFLLSGNIAIAISSRGGLMVRLGAAGAQDALTDPAASQMQMGARVMKGWIIVEPEGVKTKRSLGRWVRRGVKFARTLPPKG